MTIGWTIAQKQKRLIDEDDVIDTFTVTDFERCCNNCEDYHAEDIAEAKSARLY